MTEAPKLLYPAMPKRDVALPSRPPTLAEALALPEVQALVESIRVIAAPTYGLQAIIEDGDNPEAREEYYASLCQKYRAIAFAALAKLRSNPDA